MCNECGCAQPSHHHHHDHDDHSHHHRHEPQSSGPSTLRIEENLLAKNNRLAAINRSVFERNGVFVLNLVSSPGSGKTTLLEQTISLLKNEISFAVLEGDQQTSNDADRIAATGVPVKQINTGAGCHLDAHMISHGIEDFNLVNTDMLMIENVGNLVCPASFDLGEAHKVVVLSVTEGEDKPLKYPHMFQAAELMLINKIDLLPYLDFDMEQCRAAAFQVNPKMQIFELSCRSGEGLDAWLNWLRQQLRR
jgi:hydrogenase nickel incorporation protein HypB